MDQNCNLPMLQFPTVEKGNDSPECREDRFVKSKMYSSASVVGLTEGQNSRREAGADAVVPGVQLIISQALHPTPARPSRSHMHLSSMFLPVSFPLFPSQSCWQPFFSHQTWPSCVHKRNTEKSVTTAHEYERIIRKVAFSHVKLCLDGSGSHEQDPTGFCPNLTRAS